MVERLAPAAGSSTVSPEAPACGGSGSCDFARTVAIAGDVAKLYVAFALPP